MASAGDVGVAIGLQQLSSGQSSKAARKAWRRSRKAYAERYQVTAEDMRAAGLNPILAMGGAAGQGQAPVAAVPEVRAGEIGQSRAATSQAASARQMMASQVGMVRAQTRSEIQRAEMLKVQTQAARMDLTRGGVSNEMYNIASKGLKAGVTSARDLPANMKKIWQYIIDNSSEGLKALGEHDPLQDRIRREGNPLRGQNRRKEGIYEKRNGKWVRIR